ncbi:hypothetical protein [Rhizobium tibeticum]|uniref:hypothetical protein n=1 Tax=Rhizobium tibeticum TaxID=501024 RepID=UPI001FCD6235|nr:hypothetical protein [Rhizobium tibeticum]
MVALELDHRVLGPLLELSIDYHVEPDVPEHILQRNDDVTAISAGEQRPLGCECLQCNRLDVDVNPASWRILPPRSHQGRGGAAEISAFAPVPPLAPSAPSEMS